MNEQPLDNVKEGKDIYVVVDVVVDKCLKFYRHAPSAVKQRNKALGLIKHSFTALDDTNFIPLLYGPPTC